MFNFDRVASARRCIGLAREHHLRGEREHARLQCEKALQYHPQSFEALHLLGVLLAESGDFAGAVQYLDRAIATDPTQAVAWNNRGNLHRQLQHHAAALADYDRAIELQPDYAQAWNNRGGLLDTLGERAAALADFERAAALQPQYLDAHWHRGLVLEALGRAEEALEAFGCVTGLSPGHVEAHFHRAVCLQRLERSRAALEALDEVLRIAPGHVAAWRGRGVLLDLLDDSAGALAAWETALRLAPEDVEALFGRGSVHLGRKAHALALADFERVLHLQPVHASAWLNRGIALRSVERPAEAEQSLARALDLLEGPDRGDVEDGRGLERACAWLNRGLALRALEQRGQANACFDRALTILRRNKPSRAAAEWCYQCACTLMEFDRQEEALDLFDQAIASRPPFLAAQVNRAVALMTLGRVAQASAALRAALDHDPQDILANWNLALCSLLLGDFATGWAKYEWRWRDGMQQARHRRAFREPAWTGSEDLQGRTLLLYAEQGFGDTLQMCRYARLLAQRGARVILEVQQELLPLLRSLQGVSELVALGSPLPAFDFHVAMLSVPGALGTTAETIPAQVSYLQADPQRVAAWAARLGPRSAGARARIGLAWSGRPTHANDRNRSLRLEQLAPLLGQHCEFISLQKELRPEDQAWLQGRSLLRHFGADIADFADTAALCANMDLVISVDTSVAHLAGALGRPLWVLLPFVPDWRWLLEREDSPWYPTARLFRQRARGEWADVIGCVAQAVRQHPRPADPGA